MGSKRSPGLRSDFSHDIVYLLEHIGKRIDQHCQAVCQMDQVAAARDMQPIESSACAVLPGNVVETNDLGRNFKEVQRYSVKDIPSPSAHTDL